jgi:hypothetical protein
VKVTELKPEVVGKRIRVTAVAPSEAETEGYINDTEELMGQEGTVEDLKHGGHYVQLTVKWDKQGLNLMLCGSDEIEVVPERTEDLST